MSLFLNKKGVEEYIQQASESDGKDLIRNLLPHLEDQKTLLELGSGPGNEAFHLLPNVEATYSDYSPLFLEHLKKKHSDDQVLHLDLRKPSLEGKFDIIYSNKVLHHLSPNDLQKAIESLKDMMNSDCIMSHSFWLGENKRKADDLYFNQYTQEEILSFFSDFKIIASITYQEFLPEDSLQVIVM